MDYQSLLEPFSIHLIELDAGTHPKKKIAQILQAWKKKKATLRRLSSSENNEDEEVESTTGGCVQRSSCVQIFADEKVPYGFNVVGYALESAGGHRNVFVFIHQICDLQNRREAYGFNNFSVKEEKRRKTDIADTLRNSETLSEKLYHLLLFFYSENCLFALTSREAWHVVQNWASAKFPIQIANKWADLDKLRMVECRPLFGDNQLETRMKKEPTPYRITDMLDKVVTRLIFSVKKEPDNPLVVPCSNVKRRGRKPDVRIEIGFKMVKLGCPTNITDLTRILFEMFKETLLPMKEHGLSFVAGLIKVTDLDMEKRLDNYLAMMFVDKPAHLNLSCAHTRQFIFDSGTINLFVKIKGKRRHFEELCVWEGLAPSVSEVADKVVPAHTDFDYSTICDYYLEFGTTNRKKEKLLKFIEGEITMDNGVYLHLRNTWYQYSPDYIAVIEEEFRLAMKTCLVDAEEVGLDFKWTRKAGKFEKEDSYNRKYGGQPDRYLLGDKKFLTKTTKVELGDVFVLPTYKDKFYIVQVKIGFDRSARDAASQIRNSANFFRKNRDGVRYFFLDNYSMEMEKAEIDRLMACPDKVFVFAFVETNQSQRSLKDEISNLNLSIDLTENGADRMVDLGYADESGKLTGKFFTSTQTSLDADNLKEFGKRYLSNYRSTVVKTELISLKRELESLNYPLKIVQIPVDDEYEMLADPQDASSSEEARVLNFK